MDPKHLFSCLQNLQFWNYVGFDIILIFAGILVIWSLFSKVLLKKPEIAKPPGPLGLPFVGYLPFLGKKPHKTFLNLQKKYGDIVGLYLGKKYIVILNEYNVAREVLTHPGAQNRSPNNLYHLPQPGFGGLNGESWQEQRKFCFTAAKELGMGTGQWEETIIEEVQCFTQKLRNSRGKPIDVSQSLKVSICSNIISLLIGRRLSQKEEAEKAQVSVKYSDVALSIVGPTKLASFLPVLYKIFLYFKISEYDKDAQIIKDFSKFIKEEILRHKTSKELQDVHDFMNIYLQKISELSLSGKEKHCFSENTLEGNVSQLFLGASDTIFSSIGWLLRLMSKHKDVQNKVHAELIEAYGKGRSAKYEERERIPYTFAVMMEAQRFSSIAPLSSTRRASQDIPIRGYVIPKGSEIVPNLWLLHHDPNYWEQPDLFRPQRFLTQDGTKLIKTPPSYAPFSMGRRNCPGEITAWIEILAYFTEIVKNFEVSTPPDVEPDFSEKGGMVTRLNPQLLCFKERALLLT